MEPLPGAPRGFPTNGGSRAKKYAIEPGRSFAGISRQNPPEFATVWAGGCAPRTPRYIATRGDARPRRRYFVIFLGSGCTDEAVLIPSTLSYIY